MIGSMFGVLFDGFAYGMLLFLLSVGLSVTLGMMNFVNLAHCSFAMLGGYVAVTLMDRLGWPFLATLPVAFVVAAAVSVVLERVLYRRLYRASDLDQCLLTIGIVFGRPGEKIGIEPGFLQTEFKPFEAVNKEWNLLFMLSMRELNDFLGAIAA